MKIDQQNSESNEKRARQTSSSSFTLFLFHDGTLPGLILTAYNYQPSFPPNQDNLLTETSTKGSIIQKPRRISDDVIITIWPQNIEQKSEDHELHHESKPHSESYQTHSIGTTCNSHRTPSEGRDPLLAEPFLLPPRRLNPSFHVLNHIGYENTLVAAWPENLEHEEARYQVRQKKLRYGRETHRCHER